jgi:hypothetical protein
MCARKKYKKEAVIEHFFLKLLMQLQMKMNQNKGRR